MTPLLSSALLRAQTDDRLVELAAAGHDRAFEAIVERYRRPLQRYLRRLLSDTLAEDVVQATFINAWSSLRTGTEVRELRPWLYRIAHNAAINSLKKVGEAMEEVPESVGGFASEPAAELERRDEMHTALTPLPLLHMLMTSAGDSTVARVAEVAAGAGGAGAASVSLKAGAAAVLATGAIVTGGPELAKVVHPSQAPSAPAAASAAPKASSAAAVTPAALTSTGRTPPAASTGSSTTAASQSGRTHRQ